MNIRFKTADKTDAALLVSLYNAAFYDDFIRYGECPAYGRSTDRMAYSIEHYPKKIIYIENEAAGVISWENRGKGSYYIGCLCVIPDFQGRGIGKMAVEFFLSACPDWRRVELITPADNERNIHFYTSKCGFAVTAREKDGNVAVVRLSLSR